MQDTANLIGAPSIMREGAVTNICISTVPCGPAFVQTSIVALFSSAVNKTTVSAPMSINDVVAMPTATGQPVAAPTRTLDSLEVIGNRKRPCQYTCQKSLIWFVTFTRMMQLTASSSHKAASDALRACHKIGLLKF